MSHPITDYLATLATAAERAAYKADVHRSWPNVVGRTWTPRAGWVITVLSVPTLEHGLLRLDLGVTHDGVPVPIDGPFFFRNPPILVDDPAGDIVRTWTDRDGEHTRILREDVPAALRAMVIDALKDAVR